MARWKYFLSCEHGGNHIPTAYQPLFKGAEDVLASHRGWDPGALELFHALQQQAIDFALYSETSRLLVELNRSLHKRSLFSVYTRDLPPQEKLALLNRFYHPFRDCFFSAVAEAIAGEHPVFHVSVHSFTPVLDGEVRQADIGLLYNPAHGSEKELAQAWKKALHQLAPDLRVRFNYPYLGKTDGHVAPLRKAFGDAYAGIELEMNNRYAGNKEVVEVLVQSYHQVVAQLGSDW